MAGIARKQTEKELGRSVISTENNLYLDDSEATDDITGKLFDGK